jgi:DHA3 family macrolide efflux protein-like MFS transporter
MTDTIAPSPAVLGMRDILKIRNYRLLWLGQIISDFGDAVTNLALIILVNHLTGSTAAIALMAIVLVVPQVTFGMLAGVYIDRLDRKRIMIYSDIVRGFLVLGFVLVNSRDLLWLLYGLAFLQASIGTFFTPARSALIPTLVPENGLMSANALAQTSSVLIRVLGTGAAGMLIGSFDLYWPAFTIDAATFFVSVYFVSRVQVLQFVPEKPMATGVKAVWQQLIEGIRLIFHTRVLLGTLVAAAVAMFGLGAVNILMVPLLVNDLRVPETWFGALDFAQVTSMILSGAIVATLAARYRPTRIISLGMGGIGVAVALMAAVSHVSQLFPILFAIGWFVTPVSASASTLVQTSVPDEIRGRTGAALSTLIQTANLASMALAGIFGDVIGVRNTFVFGGLMVVFAGFASARVFHIPAPDLAEVDTGTTDLQPQPGI